MSVLEVDSEPLSLSFLTKLQWQHLKRIPFQNIEFHQKGSKWVNLRDPESLIESVLERKGGVCFHLNYSFYYLLKNLGYRCYLISAFMKETDFDHMAIVVELDVPYLVDVAYFLTQPVPIQDGYIHSERLGIYQVIQSNERFILQKSKRERWRNEYSFELCPRKLIDFEETVQLHLNGSSGFKDNVIYSRWTEKGFYRLFNDRITLYADGFRCKFFLKNFLEVGKQCVHL